MKNDKKYTIANAAGLVLPIVDAALVVYAIEYLKAKEYDILVGILFLLCVGLICTIATMKYYTLTERGIQHKFLGICYRLTPWSDLKDVMRVYYQTGARGAIFGVCGEILRPAGL